ncbi:MAG: hypothetical protein CK548_00985 [Opitutia bacterium]|nr:hypothetical protein [Opitutaceae bacterium]PHX73441.1 MAG: hypothetical protein CK548_00985 [Opitutae bacterium]
MTKVGPDAEIAELWAVEIQRRLDEIRTGKVQAIPGDQVMVDLRRRYACENVSAASVSEDRLVVGCGILRAGELGGGRSFRSRDGSVGSGDLRESGIFNGLPVAGAESLWVPFPLCSDLRRRGGSRVGPRVRALQATARLLD